MVTVHMTEAELVSDLHDALAKVQQGVEIVIARDGQPIAVLSLPAPVRPGRKLSECIALAREYEARLDGARSFETGSGVSND